MGSDEVDIYHVNDYLARKGWRMNGCQNPPGFHFCITLTQHAARGGREFPVRDLQDGGQLCQRSPATPMPASGALYGLASTPDGKGMLEQGMLAFIEATYDEV
jgi:sphinganine-1-phosphate aldolase